VRVALCLAATALAAVPASAQTGATAILDRVRVRGGRPIDFHAAAFPESVFVGQQATYQVAVLLSADAKARLRRNPEFLPPELRGLLAYELGTPSRVPPRSYDGSVYEAHVFQRALFPVGAGRETVPAPQLTYSLPQSSSYFSREERVVVQAESVTFVVKPLPLEGRPDDFNGAVGIFKSVVLVDTTTARVGDPLVLTLRVQGTGNVKLLPRPSIEIGWASTVPGSERVQVDSSGPLVRGTKEFDWILTPARDGRVSIPALRYSYFDPYARKYATAESAPLSLSIRAGTLAAADEGDGGTLLPLRSTKDHSLAVVPWNGRELPPTTWLAWLVLAAVMPIPALAWSRAKRTRHAASPAASSAAQHEHARDSQPITLGGAEAVARATMREDARRARRALLDALAVRFDQSPQQLVSRVFVARMLRRGGVTRSTTRDVMTVLDQLDALGFAAAGGDESATAAATRAVSTVLERVDAEALPAGHRLRAAHKVQWLAVILLLVSGVTLPARAHAQDADAERAARAAYERRAFGEATERFAALASARPNDPDALANWGTAAWASGDTVDAVIGWQRAARLTPMATDLQERISLLPSGARGGVADVPMIPVVLLFNIAVASWAGAWLLFGVVAYRARRTTPGDGDAPRVTRWARRVAVTLLCAGFAAGAGSWWGARALDSNELRVVTRPETLRVAPGAESDAMGGVTTGDVVRTIESRDAWHRVEHADGRRGWLPASRLVALAPRTTDTLPSPNR
jgi:hypothetical protein